MQFAKRFLLLIVIFSVSLFLRLDARGFHDLNPFKKQKSTVCLNMIVKNESAVIRRCLDSVAPLIDYWIIADTGSTDGTQQIIRDYMNEKGIPGELHERPWVNFGHNREEALVFAKTKGDYLLFIDADDVLSYPEGSVFPQLTHDSYYAICKQGKVQHYRLILVNARLNWHWHDPIHEYIKADNAKNSQVLRGIEYLYLCDGSRSKNPHKAEEDIQTLKDAIQREPNNPRLQFYLAQTYAGANDFNTAISHYQKSAELGGSEEEVFWSLMQIAYLRGMMNANQKIIEESFVKALKYCPNRPEPYYHLMAIARFNGEYAKGYELGLLAKDLPPFHHIMYFVEEASDGILVEFAQCARGLGKDSECLAICNKLLEKNTLIPEFREICINLKRDLENTEATASKT